MRRFVAPYSLVALSLALAGCSNDPIETIKNSKSNVENMTFAQLYKSYQCLPETWSKGVDNVGRETATLECRFADNSAYAVAFKKGMVDAYTHQKEKLISSGFQYFYQEFVGSPCSLYGINSASCNGRDKANALAYEQIQKVNLSKEVEEVPELASWLALFKSEPTSPPLGFKRIHSISNGQYYAAPAELLTPLNLGSPRIVLEVMASYGSTNFDPPIFGTVSGPVFEKNTLVMFRAMGRVSTDLDPKFETIATQAFVNHLKAKYLKSV